MPYSTCHFPGCGGPRLGRVGRAHNSGTGTGTTHEGRSSSIRASCVREDAHETDVHSWRGVDPPALQTVADLRFRRARRRSNGKWQMEYDQWKMSVAEHRKATRTGNGRSPGAAK